MSTQYYTGNVDPKVYPFLFEDNTCFRYTDKEKNADERNLISSLILTQLYIVCLLTLNILLALLIDIPESSWANNFSLKSILYGFGIFLLFNSIFIYLSIP